MIKNPVRGDDGCFPDDRRRFRAEFIFEFDHDPRPATTPAVPSPSVIPLRPAIKKRPASMAVVTNSSGSRHFEGHHRDPDGRYHIVTEFHIDHHRSLIARSSGCGINLRSRQ